VNAETALAIERYRLAHGGRIPDRLEDLVPAYLAVVPLRSADGMTPWFTKKGNGYSLTTTVRNASRGFYVFLEPTLQDVTFTVER